MKSSVKNVLWILLPLLVIGVGVFTVVRSSSDSDTAAVSQQESILIDYDEYRADLTSFEDKRVVYFFHARWCGTCRALEGSLTRNQGQIPSDVAFIKVDYDTEDELKEKYGVRLQHTLVQVRNDTDNSIVGKWTGQPTTQAVLDDLQEV
ncbi:MAG: thioredoxin family protein [Patescibacteria group bacterium]